MGGQLGEDTTLITTMPKILIVILNYEKPELTIRLLASCFQLDYPDFQILVVDNGSADNSRQRILTAFPSVKIIQNNTNLGFAGGVNVGLRHALAEKADYVLLLNNDTFVAPDMLTHLVLCAEKHQVAATAPVIYYESTPNRIWSAGAFRQALTGDIRGNRNGQVYEDGDPYVVDYAIACGILIRGQILQEVGLFDEQFFMYYEDLDWCWRLKILNHKIMVVPKARMWHLVSATIGGNDSVAERYYMALSSVLFFRKHTNGWRWMVVLPFRFISAVKTSLRLLRKRQGGAVLRTYWRGLWHGIRLR